jgi:hypothetical protein
MHLFYCDETNLSSGENTFFIYGGAAISSDAAKDLHDAVEAIRQESGLDPDVLLKFNPRPASLGHNDFAALKQRVIEAAVATNCTLLVSVILHDIAISPDEARRKEINRVVYHFDCLLNRRDDQGLVLVDRFNDSQIDGHLREKFSIGVRGLPYTDPMRLDHILGYHYSAIGQCHFSSVVDIVLGSFRFAVNAHASEDTHRLPTARRLLGLTSPLFLRSGQEETVDEISLFFSPRDVRVDRHRARYLSLKQFLDRNGIVGDQHIRDVRTD